MGKTFFTLADKVDIPHHNTSDVKNNFPVYKSRFWAVSYSSDNEQVINSVGQMIKV